MIAWALNQARKKGFFVTTTIEYNRKEWSDKLEAVETSILLVDPSSPEAAEMRRRRDMMKKELAKLGVNIV